MPPAGFEPAIPASEAADSTPVFPFSILPPIRHTHSCSNKQHLYTANHRLFAINACSH